MGLYTTIFMGMMPLGAIFLGSMAEYAGEANAAFLSAAAAFLVACFVWFFVPTIRTLE